MWSWSEISHCRENLNFHIVIILRKSHPSGKGSEDLNPRSCLDRVAGCSFQKKHISWVLRKSSHAAQSERNWISLFSCRCESLFFHAGMMLVQKRDQPNPTAVAYFKSLPFHSPPQVAAGHWISLGIDFRHRPRCKSPPGIRAEIGTDAPRSPRPAEVWG